MTEEYGDDDDGDDDGGDEFIVETSNLPFASEFWEGVRGETEYSFLVFEGVTLFYYDEEGKKNKTRIK